MKDIQTVTGALDPSLLGFTLMHEHLLISSWNNRITDPEWLPYEKAHQLFYDYVKFILTRTNRYTKKKYKDDTILNIVFKTIFVVCEDVGCHGEEHHLV